MNDIAAVEKKNQRFTFVWFPRKLHFCDVDNFRSVMDPPTDKQTVAEIKSAASSRKNGLL